MLRPFRSKIPPTWGLHTLPFDLLVCTPFWLPSQPLLQAFAVQESALTLDRIELCRSSHWIELCRSSPVWSCDSTIYLELHLLASGAVRTEACNCINFNVNHRCQMLCCLSCLLPIVRLKCSMPQRLLAVSRFFFLSQTRLQTRRFHQQLHTLSQ